MPSDRDPSPRDRSAPPSAAAARVRMTPSERRATAGLSGIFGLRMLGMFIVLPVMALYADTLPGGHDRLLGGLALGGYGLTQALFQIPFGWASDRWGRKRVIAAGLLVFAAGSCIAAWAPDVGWLIAGRAVQGAGAVGSAVLALTADLTRDEVRTRAMAVIGISIGATFALSLVGGPAALIGVPGIFALTGVLALGAIVMIYRAVPTPDVRRAHAPEARQWGRVFADGQLLRLNYGIFALHACLMALFVQVPFMLRDGGVGPAQQWAVYLPVLVASVLLMVPALSQADRPGRGKAVFVGGVTALLAGQLLFATAGTSLPLLIAALVVFFAAFNLMEAMLPSLVSKFAPPDIKGTATGVYSAVQFLGAFLGAAVGGWLSQHHGGGAVFGFCVALSVAWLAICSTMSAPPAYNHRNLSMGET